MRAEDPRALSPREDRRAGAILGLAVGDALGAPHEFRRPDDVPAGSLGMTGGGVFGWAPGETTDDTALAKAVLEGYRKGTLDLGRVRDAMLRWRDNDPRDIGNQTRKALDYLGRHPEVLSLPEDLEAQGNGAVMRAAPHGVMTGSPEEAFDNAFEEELHADEEALAEAEAAVEGAGCVVAVGSGTITDLCKEATARKGDVPLVVVQTAASVNAYAINMSVLLKSGVKRTGTSKWPDALLIDLPTLRGAPPVMTLAGFGDLLAAWTSPADWYLAALVGMEDAYHPAPLNMLFEQGREVTDRAAAVGRREPEALEKLARCLALGGMAASVIGKTAPLSGTEHLVSHLLDMNAGLRHLPFNFHGAQVGVATLPVAAAWEELFDGLDPAKIDVDACFPTPDAMKPVVRDAFAELDPSGAVGDECWSDYALKLERWKECRPRFETFLANWTEHRVELGEMVLPPERIGQALKEAGAPARFDELDPPVSGETAFWALKNCHLIRNRFTVADLLFFIGWWDDELVKGLLARARSAAGGR